MLLKTKILTLSILPILFSFSTTSQAQVTSGVSNQQKEDIVRKVRDYRSKYSFNHLAEGLSLFKSMPEIQKCLKWSLYGDERDPQLNPYIEKALFDIASYGQLYIQKGQDYMRATRQEYPNKAIEFCGMVPNFPDSKLPSNKFNSDGSRKRQDNIQGSSW